MWLTLQTPQKTINGFYPKHRGVTVQDLSQSTALIAIQGPNALPVTEKPWKQNWHSLTTTISGICLTMENKSGFQDWLYW